MKVVPQSAKLISMTPEPMALIERCGRVCYKSEDKMSCDNTKCNGGKIYGELTNEYHDCPDCKQRRASFAKGIIRRGHESVLEHASATFLVITDRGMTHEIVRHRLCAYSQESTRYCNYGNKGGEITVIKPSIFSEGDMASTWRQGCLDAEDAYLALINKGVSAQWARSVLPTCLKTEIAWTANMRQWRHIITLRAITPGAHPQIRALMCMILTDFLESPAAPLFEDIAAQWKE